MNKVDYNLFDQYCKYMQKVTPELIKAETTVNQIKNSQEWKKAFQYFQTMYHRGKLKERPTKANGYKIEMGHNIIQLSEIEDLLTPEQLAEIKKRL